MRLGAALTGALLTTLATPLTWPLALATFLLRGGFLLVLLPIVVLPSPVGLGNLLAPILMTVVFQGMSVEVVGARDRRHHRGRRLARRRRVGGRDPRGRRGAQRIA